MRISALYLLQGDSTRAVVFTCRRNKRYLLLTRNRHLKFQMAIDELKINNIQQKIPHPIGDFQLSGLTLISR